MEMKVALVHLTARTAEDLTVPESVVRKFI